MSSLPRCGSKFITSSGHRRWYGCSASNHRCKLEMHLEVDHGHPPEHLIICTTLHVWMMVTSGSTVSGSDVLDGSRTGFRFGKADMALMSADSVMAVTRCQLWLLLIIYMRHNMLFKLWSLRISRVSNFSCSRVRNFRRRCASCAATSGSVDGISRIVFSKCSLAGVVDSLQWYSAILYCLSLQNLTD